jgi:hypothetical protein
MLHSRTLLVIATLAGAGACVSGDHGDGLGYHDCSQNLTYSSDWTTWSLELEHNEPRTCPVDMDVPGDVVYSSAWIRDNSTTDFWSSRLIINTSDGSLVSDQVDYFQDDGYGNWHVIMYAYYHAGTGRNPCFDIVNYKMLERYPANPGSLPSAFGDITLRYPPNGPYCTNDA